VRTRVFSERTDAASHNGPAVPSVIFTRKESRRSSGAVWPAGLFLARCLRYETNRWNGALFKNISDDETAAPPGPRCIGRRTGARRIEGSDCFITRNPRTVTGMCDVLGILQCAW
jgi:hypothetical protein